MVGLKTEPLKKALLETNFSDSAMQFFTRDLAGQLNGHVDSRRFVRMMDSTLCDYLVGWRGTKVMPDEITGRSARTYQRVYDSFGALLSDLHHRIPRAPYREFAEASKLWLTSCRVRDEMEFPHAHELYKSK